MADDDRAPDPRQSVTADAARNLATTTKTPPQMTGITPRWLLKLLPWVQVDSGTYRINRKRVVMRVGGRVLSEVEGDEARVRPEDLRALPLFDALDDEMLGLLAERFTSEAHDAGDSIVEEGEKGEHFYIVARGKVEVHTHGQHGERLRIAVLGPGDYFGEIALVRECERTADVESLTPCILLSLPRADFDKLLERSPEIREEIEAHVAERLDELGDLDEHGEQSLEVEASQGGEPDLPEVHIDYEDEPREIPLSSVQTVVRVHTRVSDIYNQPINQLREQLRLAIEGIKERQEWEVLNNRDFGLLAQVPATQRIRPRYGPPTPDDMDELLSRVWKRPSFFLAHPRAIAAFGRECTRRGVPPPTTSMLGSPFLTWRGVPLVPCNKLEVSGGSNSIGTTSILLMRTGEQEQGVVGLHQTGIPGEQLPSLSVRFMGINRKAVAAYLLTLYFSAAVLTDDAIAALEDVQVGYYHDYA